MVCLDSFSVPQLMTATHGQHRVNLSGIPSYSGLRECSTLPMEVDGNLARPVLDGLQKIHTTLYEYSFLSRLQAGAPRPVNTLAVDWDIRSPWMALMEGYTTALSLGAVRLIPPG